MLLGPPVFSGSSVSSTFGMDNSAGYARLHKGMTSFCKPHCHYHFRHWSLWRRWRELVLVKKMKRKIQRKGKIQWKERRRRKIKKKIEKKNVYLCFHVEEREKEKGQEDAAITPITFLGFFGVSKVNLTHFFHFNLASLLRVFVVRCYRLKTRTCFIWYPSKGFFC